jgi:hypothetical protein
MRSKDMLCNMGTRRHPRDPPYNAEDIRAYEVRRVFNKLSLSLEHTEAIENSAALSSTSLSMVR